VKLFLRTDDCNVGDAYGYFKLTHLMRDALIAEGVQVTANTGDSFDIALHISGADYWRHVEGKKNVLFTMMETTGLPEYWRGYMEKASMVVVPCEHNKPLYQERFNGPVEVCQLGTSPEEFPYFERKAPNVGEPFRFLWVGGPSARKGQYQAVIAFTRWLRQGTIPPNAQLYLKSTDFGRTGITKYRVGVDHEAGNHPWAVDFLPVHGLPKNTPDRPEIIHDFRNLSTEQLNGLYQSAHAFLLPSIGEGWGLTLTEAMSTGLPCVWTHWSAPVDYADATIGYPLPVKVARFFVSNGQYGADGKWQSWVDWERAGGIVDPQDIIGAMQEIYDDYPRALELGKAASERMHSRYTWRHAAQRLIKILEGV